MISHYDSLCTTARCLCLYAAGTLIHLLAEWQFMFSNGLRTWYDSGNIVVLFLLHGIVKHKLCTHYYSFNIYVHLARGWCRACYIYKVLYVCTVLTWANLSHCIASGSVKHTHSDIGSVSHVYVHQADGHANLYQNVYTHIHSMRSDTLWYNIVLLCALSCLLSIISYM